MDYTFQLEATTKINVIIDLSVSRRGFNSSHAENMHGIWIAKGAFLGISGPTANFEYSCRFDAHWTCDASVG